MKKNDDINLKSKSSLWQNIWNDDIGDTHPLIPTTYTLNIEKYWEIWFHHLIMQYILS
jgi:hypothetical protein